MIYFKNIYLLIMKMNVELIFNEGKERVYNFFITVNYYYN